MSLEIETNNYLQVPVLDAARAIALGKAIETAAPLKLAAARKQPLKVSASLGGLQSAFAGDPMPAVDDRRPADRAADASVAAFYGRIRDYAALPVERYPKAARAAEVLRTLFPEGLAFLRFTFTQEWAEIDKLQRKIRTLELTAFLEEIAGKEFLENMDYAQDAYGKALGITQIESPTYTPVRAEKLRVFRKALNKYLFSVLAQIDEEDEEVMGAVRQALKPIDAIRASQARRGVNGEDVEAVEPNETEAPVAAPIASGPPANGPLVPPPRAVSVPAPNGTPS